MNMEEYVERVTRAATERKGEPIFNGSVDHARVIAATMFKNAKSSVAIFAGDLDARVYGPDDVLDEAEFFLSRSENSVRVILEEADTHLLLKHPFFKRFSGHHNLIVKQLDKDIKDVVPFHLMVADNDCYRFEQDKSKVAAVASWGDVEGGTNLLSIFDSLWSASSDVTMPVEGAETGEGAQ